MLPHSYTIIPYSTMYRILTLATGFFLLSSAAFAQDGAPALHGEGLGDLPGGDFSSGANDVSGDGSVVVGYGAVEGGNNEAFVWMDEGGMQSVKEVLENENGLDLTGWTLSTARGVSGEGTVIVGNGTNPDGDSEGWRAVLAEPGGGETARYVATTGNDTGSCTDEENPCASISYALSVSFDTDTVKVADGVYTESFAIDKSLALQGQSEAGTIIQAHEEPGEADSRVITVDTTEVGSLTVEISDVTIRHGNAIGEYPDNAGGGILNNGSTTLDLSSVTFSSNSADYGGGGIFNIGSSPTLADVTFHENSAGTYGGGAFNLNSSATLTNVTFSGNTAGSNGGGIYNQSNSSPVITDAMFSGNVAAGGLGGGMYNSNISSPQLTNVTFSENMAEIGGGMTNINGSSPSLTSVTFTENTAESNAGGMYNVLESSPSLSEVDFDGNTAEGNGGGMFSQGSSPTLTAVTFSGNVAGAAGGGMFNVGSSPTLSGVAFSENESVSRAGGMHNESESSPLLTNVIFSGNVTGAFGGGMHNGDSSSPTLINVTFTGNAVENVKSRGGGISNVANSSPVLTNVTISGNSVELNGGGMYNSDSFPLLTNVIIWNNEADRSTTSTSASVFNKDGAEPDISYSLIANSGGSGDWDPEIGADGGNNLDENPLFVDTPNPSDAPTTDGDLHLTEGSATVEAGDPGTDLGVFPTDEGGDPIDLDGSPRVFHEVIDIGAYEYQGTIADEEAPEEIVQGLTLPAPNPVRETAAFTVAVEESQTVTVEVFDVTGRRVQALYDGALSAGMSEGLMLDASAFPAGVYVIRATGEDFTETRRITILR